MRRFVLLSVVALLGGGAGCATAPPIPAEVGTVMADPAPFRNKRVEIQGRVVDYERPHGDKIRTWGFAIEDLEGARISVYASRRYPEDVEAANRLVRRSLDEKAPIFVIGYLRSGRYDSQSGGPRLDLREVQYKTEVVRLRENRGYYAYDSPYRFHFGFGYYHGHHHHHYGHHYYHHYGHYY